METVPPIKENIFIALPTYFNAKSKDCDEKIAYAENLSIFLESYCPECLDDAKGAKQEGKWYIRPIDIKDFSFTDGEIQIRTYLSPEDIYYVVNMEKEDFLVLLDKAGVTICH